MNQQQQEFLLSTFREEVETHIIGLTRGLVDLEESENDAECLEIMREIMRLLHTVKGSARMLGFADITRVAHAMEDLVGSYRSGQRGHIPREEIDLLFTGLDTISELVRKVTQPNLELGTPLSQLSEPEEIEGLLEQLKARSGAIGEANPQPSTKTEIVQVQPALPPEVRMAPATEIEAGSAAPKGDSITIFKSDSRADETIRVRLDKLDSMINLAGELVINKLQNEEHLQALQNLLGRTKQRNRLLIQLRDFVVEQTPVEERSRLLGLTELFSFGDEDLKQAKKMYLERQAKLNGNGNNGSNGNGFSLGNGDKNTMVYNGSGMVLDARDIRKIYDKLEQLVQFDQQIEQQLVDMMRERKRYNLNFETAADELRRNMLGIRMLPLDTLLSRFNRLVRDLANERGKQARLIIVGGTVEIDKRILEEIADPVRHMLQNSIDHGIELPEERLAKGKSPEGTITVSASQRGSHVHITIEDDGKGLDAEQLMVTAIRKGFISEEEARNFKQNDMLELVFRPGFTTRHSVDEVSGRGVGLDVVQQNIKRLSGRVALTSEKDEGTTFTLEIPLTLATIDVLLVRAAGQLFAIPSVMVETSFRPARSEVISVETKPTLRFRDQLVPLVKLNEVLNLTGNEKNTNESKDDRFQAVVLGGSTGGTGQDRSTERFICFEVEELVDEREVVVKGLGKFLENVPNVAGATLLGADGLALILDAFGLVQTVKQGGVAPVFRELDNGHDILFAPQARRILVVDDSLATRELERSILETAGYEVETARDGQEALQICHQRTFDLVLTDIEMPNMDGFRLTSQLSSDPRMRDMPVIVVSSRDSDEDKRKGLQAGAKAYIVKGQFEQTKLLDTIARLIA